MKASRRGFVLMEVIPALGLLVLVMSLSARLLWLSLESRLAGAQLRLEEEALGFGLSMVQPGQEEVLMVWRTASGEWRLRRFPDESWLPSGSAAGQEFLFKWAGRASDASMDYWLLQPLD